MAILSTLKRCTMAGSDEELAGYAAGIGENGVTRFGVSLNEVEHAR